MCYPIVIFFIEFLIDSLVIYISQHAIHKSAFGIIWITGFITFYMMYVVRYNIYFFSNCSYNKILCNKPPEFIAESIWIMGAKTVKPDSAVSTHNDHSIQQECDQQPDRKMMKNKKIQKGQHAQDHAPANSRDPVLFCFEKIHPGKKFPE